MRSQPGCGRCLEVQLSGLSRMADAERWGEAVARGLGWAPGTFANTLGANRAAANELALEESPVAVTLIDLAIRRPSFRGTMQELLQTLTGLSGQSVLPALPIGRRVLAPCRASCASLLPSFDRSGSTSSSCATVRAGSSRSP